MSNDGDIEALVAACDPGAAARSSVPSALEPPRARAHHLHGLRPADPGGLDPANLLAVCELDR